MGLKGKVAIVTSAGWGVGEGIATVLPKEGFRVIVNDFFLERAEKLAKNIVANGGEAFALQADVTDYDSVKKMVNAAKDKSEIKKFKCGPIIDHPIWADFKGTYGYVRSREE